MKPHDGPASWTRARTALTDYLALALGLAGLVAVFSLSSQNFLSRSTFLAVANQVPDITVVAVGMTFVLIAGGIDLSVGSVLALSSGVLGIALAQWGWPVEAAIAAGILAGMLCGLANGAVVVRWSLPSFIVTLGMLEAARGATYLITDSRTVYVGDSLEWLTTSTILGIPMPFATALLVVAAGHWILTRTVFGRHLQAVGYSEQVTRYAGVNPGLIRLAVFASSGLLSGLAAVFHTSRLFSANPNAGIGLELQAIAAVVIGGTSLLGGRGSVFKSLFGVLIIAVLGAGLAQLGVQEPTKRLITGAVIVLAVVVDTYRRRSES